MKKYLILCLFVLSLFGGSVLATVGGPTYISQIAWDKVENSLYYTLNGNDGRGCPPIIHKINLSTLKNTEVKSCDQLEQEGIWDTPAKLEAYNKFRSDTYKNLSYTGSVSLLKNNIDIEVKFLKAEMMEGFDEPVWNEFEARILQDDKELGKINFRGCAKDQPHIFEGYMIPGTNAMAMLISNKGDCFEGGYVKESLHMIKGVKYTDTNIVRSFKEISATEPNIGNMVVYAEGESRAPSPIPESIPVSTPETSTETTSNKILYLVLVLGIGFGFIFAIVNKIRK